MLIVTGGDDGCVRIWDKLSGSCVKSLFGHRAAVTKIGVFENLPTSELANSGSGSGNFNNVVNGMTIPGMSPSSRGSSPLKNRRNALGKFGRKNGDDSLEAEDNLVWSHPFPAAHDTGGDSGAGGSTSSQSSANHSSRLSYSICSTSDDLTLRFWSTDGSGWASAVDCADMTASEEQMYRVWNLPEGGGNLEGNNDLGMATGGNSKANNVNRNNNVGRNDNNLVTGKPTDPAENRAKQMQREQEKLEEDRAAWVKGKGRGNAKSDTDPHNHHLMSDLLDSSPEKSKQKKNGARLTNGKSQSSPAKPRQAGKTLDINSDEEQNSKDGIINGIDLSHVDVGSSNPNNFNNLNGATNNFNGNINDFSFSLDGNDPTLFKMEYVYAEEGSQNNNNSITNSLSSSMHSTIAGDDSENNHAPLGDSNNSTSDNSNNSDIQQETLQQAPSASKVTVFFPGHQGAVNFVAKISDSCVLSGSSEDGTVRCWDIFQGGLESGILEFPSAAVGVVVPDGEQRPDGEQPEQKTDSEKSKEKSKKKDKRKGQNTAINAEKASGKESGKDDATGKERVCTSPSSNSQRNLFRPIAVLKATCVKIIPINFETMCFDHIRQTIIWTVRTGSVFSNKRKLQFRRQQKKIMQRRFGEEIREISIETAENGENDESGNKKTSSHANSKTSDSKTSDSSKTSTRASTKEISDVERQRSVGTEAMRVPPVGSGTPIDGNNSLLEILTAHGTASCKVNSGSEQPTQIIPKISPSERTLPGRSVDGVETNSRVLNSNALAIDPASLGRKQIRAAPLSDFLPGCFCTPLWALIHLYEDSLEALEANFVGEGIGDNMTSPDTRRTPSSTQNSDGSNGLGDGVGDGLRTTNTHRNANSTNISTATDNNNSANDDINSSDNNPHSGSQNRTKNNTSSFPDNLFHQAYSNNKYVDEFSLQVNYESLVEYYIIHGTRQQVRELLHLPFRQSPARPSKLLAWAGRCAFEADSQMFLERLLENAERTNDYYRKFSEDRFFGDAVAGGNGQLGNYLANAHGVGNGGDLLERLAEVAGKRDGGDRDGSDVNSGVVANRSPEGFGQKGFGQEGFFDTTTAAALYFSNIHPPSDGSENGIPFCGSGNGFGNTGSNSSMIPLISGAAAPLLFTNNSKNHNAMNKHETNKRIVGTHNTSNALALSPSSESFAFQISPYTQQSALDPPFCHPSRHPSASPPSWIIPHEVHERYECIPALLMELIERQPQIAKRFLLHFPAKVRENSK